MKSFSENSDARKYLYAPPSNKKTAGFPPFSIDISGFHERILWWFKAAMAGDIFIRTDSSSESNARSV